MNSRLTAIAALFFALALSSTAFGHGEEPISQRLYSVENGWILKGNFGITSSNFEGFVCEEAFLGGDKFVVIPLSSTRWVTFGETSVHVTDDGCTFDRTHQLTQAPADADGAGTNAIFLSNDVESEGIWLSEDSGESWAKIDYDITDIQLTGVRFAGPNRAIVSGYDRANSGDGVMLEVALEAGVAVNPITIPDGLKYPYILDAKGEELVWLGRGETQNIFWGPLETPDQDTFEITTWPAGAALAEDAQTLWLAGLEEGKGLTIGTRGDSETIWETVAMETTAACVGRHEGETYLCSMRRFDDADLMKVGEDGSLEPLLDYRDLRGARTDCSAESNVGDVCPLVWVEVEKALRLAGSDAGTSSDDVGTNEPDMGESPSDMGLEAEPTATGGSSDSGCATASSGSTGLVVILGLLLAASFRRRI